MNHDRLKSNLPEQSTPQVSKKRTRKAKVKTHPVKIQKVSEEESKEEEKKDEEKEEKKEEPQTERKEITTKQTLDYEIKQETVFSHIPNHIFNDTNIPPHFFGYSEEMQYPPGRIFTPLQFYDRD